MKFWDIAGFELAYQSRRPAAWLYFAVLLLLTFVVGGELSGDYARSDGSYANSPFIVALVMLLFGTLALLAGCGIAGDAAARDADTRQAPLVYTTPVGKAAYLGGRFLGAFGVYALVLLAVPCGALLTGLVMRSSDLAGPFRPGSYAAAYLVLTLPNAFVAMATLFALAALGRRATASYLGGLLLVAASAFAWAFLAQRSGRWDLAKLADPLGAVVLGELSLIWTAADRNAHGIGLHSPLLANRLLWIGVALGVLGLTCLRFRFAHHASGRVRGDAVRTDHGDAGAGAVMSAIARVPRTFGVSTRARQLAAVAAESFHGLVRGWGGLMLPLTAAFLVFSVTPLAHLGVPLLATAQRVTALLGAPLTDPSEINWIVVPLLIAFYAGEATWRDRDARLSEVADAAPVPDWLLFLGKAAAVGLVLATLQVLMIAGGMAVQLLFGHRELQPALYLEVLIRRQLPGYLLFAVLALVIHALMNHKYVAHLVVAIAYGFMLFAPVLGVEHNLLIFGAHPGWTFSDMRRFGPFAGAWAWFTLYWAAWALLLSLIATLLHVRGTQPDLGSRLGRARRRMTRRTAAATVAALLLIATVGGFIFYNTNILHAYGTAADAQARRADYERRYGQYKAIPQPSLAGTELRVEIYPDRHQVQIRGAFDLVNASAVPIDRLHVGTRPGVETTSVRFDRPAATIVSDERLGHHIHALAEPLEPGASLRMDFEVQFLARGFPNRGGDSPVAANGTTFTNQDWLPVIGYDPDRELRNAGIRQLHRLPVRPAMTGAEDGGARSGHAAARTRFEAVVGTAQGQVAVAPGRLRRTWTHDGRRYFHYVTDVPIRNDYAFVSAAYAAREARWNHVTIEVLYHPAHAWNVDRMIRSVQASLEYYTARFGPYPHGQIRLIEHPGDGVVLHAAPVNISFQEGFALLDPASDPRDIDLPFAVVAHEVAHQWWGNALVPARADGAAVLTETLAWYSALEVVERSLGREHLARLLAMMRRAYVTPRSRADVPLLRADDWFLAYRKGPFAMYALREYLGADRVQQALQRLLAAHGSGTPPLPTSLDLYRELLAVTPDALRQLPADLFEHNTFWELATDRATAEPDAAGGWRVVLDVRARKVVVDPAGVETERAMDDPVEIGVFARSDADAPRDPLYLQMHRLRSGRQRIVVRVPARPALAGIDPRRLLIDVEGDDNVKPLGTAPSPR